MKPQAPHGICGRGTDRLKSARIHFYPDAEDVHLGGAENLTAYNVRADAHAHFCKICGTHMLVSFRQPPLKGDLGHNLGVGAVTLRILHNVDLNKININRYEGREMLPLYVVK